MAHLEFKGRVFVDNLHLAVPFHEWKAVRSKGLSEKPSLDDNLIIEGDNLAALKALLPHYHGKVKCIYIDPPYNTGNEGWKYNDRVNSPMIKQWLGKVVDREDLTRHDKWCCMMLPRLRLLRELMRQDGAIFVSIDDNEIHFLRCLMDLVFGEENLVATFVRRRRLATGLRTTAVSPDHEYILCYARRMSALTLNGLARDKDDYPLRDEVGFYRSTDLTVGMGRTERPNQYFPIQDPHSGTEYLPPKTRVWRFEPATMRRQIDADNVIWPSQQPSTRMRRPRYKTRYDAASGKGKPISTWLSGTSDIKDPDMGGVTVSMNTAATKELRSIFGDHTFSYPKPVSLVRELVRLSTGRNSLVLDSFAGSGTTAHAVLALNAEDGGNRRFLLVECEDYVHTLTAERVRRVIKGVPKSTDPTVKKGFGGSFSYFKLGRPLRKEAMLHPTELPTYERLAAYVFFTATREEFDASQIDRTRWFIGKSRSHDVFLIYTDKFAELKDLALTADIAGKLSRSNRPKLVFAPTKYLDLETLYRHGITFHQLPFEIYETVDRLSR